MMTNYLGGSAVSCAKLTIVTVNFGSGQIESERDRSSWRRPLSGPSIVVLIALAACPCVETLCLPSSVPHLARSLAPQLHDSTLLLFKARLGKKPV